MKKADSQQSGFSLVGVLLALGITGIAASLYSSGSMIKKRASSDRQQKERSVSVETTVTRELSSIIASLNPSTCLSPSSIASKPFVFDGRDATLSFKTDFRLVWTNLDIISDAYDRCDKPIFITAGQINDPAKSRLHFCLAINNADAKTRAAQAFIEVEVRLTSTSTNTDISCAAFQADRSAVAQVAYGIYIVEEVKSTAKQGIIVIRSPAAGVGI